MVQTQIFDLYFILVESVFGSILNSFIGLCIIFIILGFITRMSPLSIIFLICSFTVVFGVGYIGALAVIPFFIGAFTYMIYPLVQFIMGMRR